MEFFDCAKTRRSVRRFTEEAVPVAVIEEIVGAAAYAPSWKNTQITRYTVVTDRALIDNMAENMVLGFTFNEKSMKGAAALVVVSYVTGRSGFERDGSYSTPKGDGFEMFDAGIATQTFCLAAHDKGLGTVVLGYFDEEKIIPALNLPENQKVAAVVAMGYPKFQPEAPARKDVADLLTVL
ncbi:nitroreductase family protein [Bengtsoniella intestinalis]|uniref:nitroreductase family protein n=1 Tax=Bengtsoniella intestinalis TaxID=3073143 RepID=UPI00391F1132